MITEDVSVTDYCVTFSVPEINPLWLEITTLVDSAFESALYEGFSKDEYYLAPTFGKTQNPKGWINKAVCTTLFNSSPIFSILHVVFPAVDLRVVQLFTWHLKHLRSTF